MGRREISGRLRLSLVSQGACETIFKIFQLARKPIVKAFMLIRRAIQALFAVDIELPRRIGIDQRKRSEICQSLPRLCNNGCVFALRLA
jgi:hypothetical protein